MNPVDAKTYPLQDILKPERRYVIPTFQRDYEWTLDGQWRLLFEDLVTTANRLLEVRGEEDTSKQRSREQSLPPHFLGAIVCAGLPFPSGGVAVRSVIDGQQRLTTVQLLIRGLADVLAEAGSDRTKTVKRMLFNPDDVVDAPEEVYKLWPRRRDREVWPRVMEDTFPTEEDSSSHRYFEARRFFADEARGYAISEGHGLDPDRLQALADAVASLFKLVVIDLDDNDDAQVIFEVLNGRQTPLSAIDLVKNLLFLRGELADDDVERLYDAYWAHFDDPWWKEAVGRGHAQRGRRDVLLSTWLTAVTGNETNVGHLYREAREYLATGPSTETILQQLNDYARAYQTIYEALPVEDDRLRRAYRNLRALEITTAIPVLAWLHTRPTEHLSHADQVLAVQAIESWAMRRAYTGAQTRGYGSFLTRLLREARDAEATGAAIVDSVIASLSAETLPWPSNADIRDAFASRRFYDGMNQQRIRLLLGSIDQLLRNEDPNEPAASINYEELQIEHVMPRAWKDHWPLLDEDESVIPADPADPLWLTRGDQRRKAVDGIGNLTLVTSTFNRGVSNLGWATKRSELARQKSLVINYPIAQSEAWTEASIGERAARLAESAARLWPAPDAFRDHG